MKPILDPKYRIFDGKEPRSRDEYWKTNVEGALVGLAVAAAMIAIAFVVGVLK